MAIKVMHIGDLHIGNFPGPEVDGENMRFKDICASLNRIISEAAFEQPDVVVIAGDVFHQARVWSDRGLKENQTAVRFIRRLADIGMPVVVVMGTPNHDSRQQFESLKNTFYDDVRVDIVTEPQVLALQKGGEYFDIACLPGFDRGYYRAKNPGLSKEEENEVFTQAIEDMIIGLKAQCRSDAKTVLVSHFTITGCNMESGQTAFFSQFEPVVYPSTLQAADFDLVCFGHIHRPQQLEGCRNTFYCGAISALNFNDEGQERGYWTHTITDRAETESVFHEIPTRAFLTIRLDDEDVARIISGGDAIDISPNALPDVQDKIVRVLYNCTDEHNKAFNHALYEKMLYAAGAFWVQEISPQKITISVDRRSMEGDDTPEDNLVAYLEEKQIEPEEIAETVELARPIIAEAEEKAKTEKKTGLFVPVEIEVRNYRNYREEKFSFDDIRFCTINGENGAGKSSLFMDAMLDALYEEPREGDLTGWICNDPDARSGAIMFTFKIGDGLFRVTRTRQKSGKATLNIAEMVDGEWTDRSREKYKDTQAEIINLIGMDSMTFRSCALIMQDQYGLILQADKEERMNILGNILGLSIYSEMEESAAAKLTDTNREIRSLMDKTETLLSGLPDQVELDRKIATTQEAAETMKRSEQEETASISSLKAALNTQLEAAERAMKHDSKISTLASNLADKEAMKTLQVAKLSGAEAILADEDEIRQGVARYEELAEREKEEIKAKAVYDGLEARRAQISQSVRDIGAKQHETSRKIKDVEESQATAKDKIAREAELTEKHQQYSDKGAELTKVEAAAPEWQQKNAELQEAEKKLEELVRERNEAHRKCEDRYEALKKKVELLGDSGCPDIDNARCRFLSDALAAKEELPKVEKELYRYRTETSDAILSAQGVLEAARKALSEVLYTPERYSSLQSDLRGLEQYERAYNDLTQTKEYLAMLEERADELEKQMQEYGAEVKRLTEELNEVERQIEAGADSYRRYEELKHELFAAKAYLEREKELPVARERKTEAEKRIAELNAEISGIKAEIEEEKTELSKELAASAGREEMQRKVDEAERLLQEHKECARSIDLELGRLQQQKENAREKVEEAKRLQQKTTELGTTAARFERLKKAFSQDGIPHNIVRSIIPIFEATATNILGQMSGGKMSVEFVTEKTLKSNSKKEVTTLDIIINDCNTGRLPYMSRSGGERVKAALAVILAMSEIKSSRAGVQMGFLWIDEPPYLDQAGTQAYCDALEAIQARYKSLKIMAITHDPAMKSRFPQNVDIVKTEAGSKVVYE